MSNDTNWTAMAFFTASAMPSQLCFCWKPRPDSVIRCNARYLTCWVRQIFFVILDWRCYFLCEFVAEGLTFGNRVYWVRFDEEFSDKVILFSWSCCFIISLLMCGTSIILEMILWILLTWISPCLFQKFKSSSPFGIKYTFHLEVEFLFNLLFLNIK